MPSANPLLSIVILSWNRKDDLRATLGAVFGQEYRPCEVIVVDNGSTDGSAEMVQALFPAAQTIALPENIGIDGLNAGLRAATGEFIILLDDDSYPLPDTLPRLVTTFQDDPHVGIAAGRILRPGGLETRPSRREGEAGQEVPTFIGCGVGLRRAALEPAGFFDAAFFLYGNELDLAARVLEAGYTVRYFPELTFVHAVSPVNRSSLRAEYYTTRNLLWIIWKYFPLLEAVGLSLRVVTEKVAYRLLRGDLPRAWAVLGGVWGALTAHERPSARHVLSRETRRQVVTHIDEWYPPAWAWLRARLQLRG